MKHDESFRAAVLLPLSQVAAMLGVCNRTIQREVDRGRFPVPVRIGRRVLFARSEVEAYLSRKLAKRQ